MHRTIGTLVGVTGTGFVPWGGPPSWLLIMIVALSQFGAELFVGRHYSTALVFITSLALLMVHLSSPTVSSLELVFDHVPDVALGVVVGMAMVLMARLVRVGPEPSRAWTWLPDCLIA